MQTTRPTDHNLTPENLEWIFSELEASLEKMGFKQKLGQYEPMFESLVKLLKNKYPESNINTSLLASWGEARKKLTAKRIKQKDFMEIMGFIDNPHPLDYKHPLTKNLIYFEIVEKATPIKKANLFYNGYEITWSELASEFDVRRNLEIDDHEHMDFFLEKKIVEKNNSPYFIFIHGSGGVGKTTILKRLLYNSISVKTLVVYLNNKVLGYNNDKQKFFEEITFLLSLPQKKIFGINDLSDILYAFNINDTDFINFFENADCTLLVTDHSHRMSDKPKSILSKENHIIYPIYKLSLTECKQFAAKVCDLEAEGKLEIVRADLTFEKKLTLIIESANQHLLVALYQMRFNEQFEKIMRKEYDSIKNEDAKKCYGLICFFHVHDVFIPPDLAIRTIKGEDTLATFEDIMQSLKGIIEEYDFTVSARHRLIAQIICKFNFTELSFKYRALEKTFKALNIAETSESEFFKKFFSKPKIYRKIYSEIVDKKKALLLNFYDTLINKYSLTNKTTTLYECYALSLKLSSINELEKARTIFKTLFESPFANKKSFYLYQIAWIDHIGGQYDDAAENAEAALKLSNSPSEIFKGIQILELNTYENILKAEPYFEKLIEFSVERKKYLNHYENYKELKKEIIPLLNKNNLAAMDFVLKLRPGLQLLKNFINDSNSKILKDRLFGSLYNMQRNQEVDETEIEELIEGIEINRKKLEGLVYAHEARNLFLKIRNHNIPVEVDKIKTYFEKSIELNENNSYTHTWFGTFYKDIFGNFSDAEVKYRRSISLIDRENFNKEGIPLFYNNLALLLIDRSRPNPKNNEQDLIEAYELLKRACSILDNNDWDFTYPYDNLTECKKIMRDNGIAF